ncbi:MAG: glycosyltransferase family 2 protein [Clostridium sp.]|nr:glycosyltransferase family 2 protein [Prevotella sp.]MCM1429061.1 glycosyltransferase family 2 protein [Clostridium sp.]
MKLSVIVLTFNQREMTMRLLRSLLPLLRDGDLAVEVVLVDNGSTDDTLAVVEQWREESGIDTDKIQKVPLNHNYGVAGGRNVGLDRACGDYLLLLDNDTIADIATIKECLSYLKTHPDCGICAPALYSPDGDLQSSAKPYPGLKIKLAHILRRGKELRIEREELKKRHPFYLIGAFQMFSRQTYEQVGKLDDRIFYGPEDADYCMRVRSIGKTIDYLPELRLTHDWRRATRRSPFSPLGRRHLKALLYFWLKKHK